MDLEELDIWYEEQKEKIFDEYVKAAENRENKQEAEEKYKENMKNVREKYTQLYEKTRKPTLKKKYSAKIKDLKEKIKISEIIKIPGIKFGKK